MAQILELQDPIEDEMGYVYDKASLLQYIRRELQRHPGREVQCPVAGVPSPAFLVCGPAAQL